MTAATIQADGSLARYGRSFHFASRLLPDAERARVADAYAYCRATDDLVDEPHGATERMLHERLDAWVAMSRQAYAGEASGNPLVDRVMRDMRAADVPFRYVDELTTGMRMDIGRVRYRDMGELRVYTHRVAGVVGLWMANLFGVREPWLLERAAALGHAMQLTNIVRDVGADWDMGRVYLPASLLRSYGVTEDEIAAMRAGRRISPAYRACIEAVMTLADASYQRAFEAMPALPPAFRRTVAVAAEVYRGIHVRVRAAGYDTVTARAATSFGDKIIFGARGLHRLTRQASAFQNRTLVAS